MEFAESFDYYKEKGCGLDRRAGLSGLNL